MRNLCHSRSEAHAFHTCAAHFSVFLICLSYRHYPIRPFGAPPSYGRRERPREPLPREGAAERSEAGLAFFWGGARVLVYRLLETISPLFFIPLVPYPPLRGTFPLKERLCIGDSDSLANGALETISHSLSYRHCPIRFASLATFPTRGRLCLAETAALSQMAHLRRSFPLFFIPLEPYPARSARHLPHAGKALYRG